MKMIIRFTVAGANIKKQLESGSINTSEALIEYATLKITLETLVKIEYLNQYDSERCQLVLDDLKRYIDKRLP